MRSDIRKANKEYYSSKGENIYSDFSTFAQGSALATCNAIEFASDFSSREGTVVVCEYGIGKGDFAKTFLDTLKTRNRKLYRRTRYYLFDFSEKMIESARKNLKTHGAICILGKFDAAAELPFLQFDYCRINELLTDLPAELFMRKEEGIYNMGMENGALVGRRNISPPIFASRFLARIDEGRAMPFNFTAEKFLLELCRRGKKSFRVDLFDYGFYSADDVFDLEVEEWNRLMIRDFGGQLTVDLNFPQMLSALAADGFRASLEKQKNYAERVLGCPLELSDDDGKLDYVEVKKKSDITEDDDFYHLRIGK